MATIWIPEGFDPNKPPTNFDAIRAMNAEELARKIAQFTGYEGNPEEVAFWLDWLQQEAR